MVKYTPKKTISTKLAPQDLTLRLLLAQRYELGASPLPTSQLEAADEAYRSPGRIGAWCIPCPSDGVTDGWLVVWNIFYFPIYWE